MKSLRLTLAGSAGLLALLLAGCATNVNTVERAQSQATPNMIADKRIITDNTRAGRFRVDSLNQATVSGSLLKVQATITNLKNSVQTLKYKFEWISEDGMAVESPNEAWKVIHFQGRETKNVSTVAISPRAVDFRLKLQE